MRKTGYLLTAVMIIGFAGWTFGISYAIDSDATRQTLKGIDAMNVVIEELQPNIQRFAPKFGLQRERIQTDVELMLKKAGIAVLTHDQWLKAPGRPFLYVVVNTHEYEKYWYAYDVRVQLRQGVILEMNPSITTMADTWSISMTGIANVGRLNLLKGALYLLVERFVEAQRSVNRKDQKMGR
jgi:hypothetical protein